MFYPGVVGKGMFYPGEVIEGMFYPGEVGRKYSTGFDTNARPAARVHKKFGRSTNGSGPVGPSVHNNFKLSL